MDSYRDQNETSPKTYGLHLLIPNVIKTWYDGLQINTQRQTDITTIPALMIQNLCKEHKKPDLVGNKLLQSRN